MPQEKKKIKPIAFIEGEERLDLVFYEEFLKYHQLLKEDKENLTYLTLSGLFLYLTLETYVTWMIRYLLERVNRKKNRRIRVVWNNHFETSAYLNKKIQFFADVFLNKESDSDIKEINKFIQTLGELRNKIVHGHKFSITWDSKKVIKKTRLAELLNFKEINNCYGDFKKCVESISVLMKRIYIEELMSGIPSKEWVFEYLSFKIK